MKNAKKLLLMFVLLCAAAFLAGGRKADAYAKDNQAAQLYPKAINKKNKVKVGKYYFWGDSKDNLFFSKNKSGKKKTKIAKKVATAVTDGKKVLYQTDNKKSTVNCYTLKNKKKKTVTLKAANKLSQIYYLNIYGNNLYFSAEKESGDGIVYVYYKFNINSKKLKQYKKIDKEADSRNFGATNGRYFLFRNSEFNGKADPDSYYQTYLFDCKTSKIIKCKDRGDGFFYNGKLHIMSVGANKTILKRYALPSQKSSRLKTIKGNVDRIPPVINGCVYYNSNEKFYKYNLKTKSTVKISEKLYYDIW